MKSRSLSPQSSLALSRNMFVLWWILTITSVASTTTEQRKVDYRNTCIANYQPIIDDGDSLPDRDNSLPIWTFQGDPLPEGSLDRAFARITSDSITVGDMDLTLLVRVLYLSDDAQQVEIQTRLQDLYDDGDLRFWLERGETYSTYWTENHMIMWLSCTLLLQPWVTFRDHDEAIMGLERRLQHFLDTKIQYGLYEFYSSVYYKFTLGALLNIIDFATDETTRQKALTVFEKALTDVLMIATTEGYYYPPAARNPQRYYNSPLYLDMVWFFTGTGVQPTEADFLGSFISTSNVDLDRIAVNFSTDAYEKFELGHDVKNLRAVHDGLPRDDRALMYWTAGAYSDSLYVGESRYIVTKYDLYNHRLLAGLGELLRWTLEPVLWFFSWLFPGQTEGSNFSGAKVTVYKNNGIALTSLEDYNVGERGSEQFPWCATVGDIAVFTQSGVYGPTFQSPAGISNTHLPQVKQDEHVALISYRPKLEVYLPLFFINLFGANFKTRVALRFPFERFDEITEQGQWIFGRKGPNFVGVWRHSLSQNDCSDETGFCREYYFSYPRANGRQQVWATVVGNTITHTSFEQFQQTVAQGEVEENKPHFLSWLFGFTYKTSVQVDGKSLSSEI